jgi:hypothetical protein
MADVLNEAADSEDRNLEGNRRQALTLQQIKSDQQRNDLAAQQGARDETRFGYEKDRLVREKAAFDRAENIRKDVEASAQRHLFADVPNPQYNNQAIPTTVEGPAGAVAVDPNANIPKTIRQPIDLGSREGLKATVNFLGDAFAARIKHGEMKPEEITQMMSVRKNLEDKGVHDDLLAAFKGDAGALDAISAKMGLPSGTARLEVNIDQKSGIPGVFASIADGKGGYTKKNVDYLVAALDKGVYDAVLGTGMTTAKDKSTINYQNASGAAATSNAATSATNAKNSGRLIDAKVAALDDKGAPVNTAAYRSQFFSSQLDADGKNLMLPSGSSNLGRIRGVGQELGLSMGQSDDFAKTEWANLMGLRDTTVAKLKKQEDPNGVKHWNKQDLVNLEDRALTGLTEQLISDKSDKGEMFQKASAYAKRRAEKRASAMKTDKEED